MSKPIFSFKKHKKLFALIICLIIFWASFQFTYGYLDKQSILNASFSKDLITQRNSLINIFDAVKGLTVYKKISDSFKKDYPDDSIEKLTAMVQWVHNNIRPQYTAPVISGTDNFYNILRRGTGYCDNDAQAFDILAFMQGYKVHSLALYNKQEKLSPHTLNEIYWNNKWVIVDPWLDVVFMKDGKLLTKEDIVNNSQLLNNYNYPSVVTAETFKDSYILKPFPLNAMDKVLEKINIFKSNKSDIPDTPGTSSTAAVPDASNEQNKIDPKKNFNVEKLLVDYNAARDADLSGNYQKAYSLYNSIQLSSLLGDLKETIDYQKAVALYNNGNFKDAKVLLDNFLDKYKESDWKPSVCYFLAKIDIRDASYTGARHYLAMADDAANRNLLNSLEGK